MAFDELQRGIRYVEDLGFHDVAYDFDKWNESNTSDMHRSVYQTMSTIDEDIPAYKQIRIREFLARSYFFNLLAPDYFPDESVVPEIRSRLQMPWLEITKMREERDDVPF